MLICYKYLSSGAFITLLTFFLIHNACLKGARSVTVNADLIKQLIYHPSTDLSVDNFIKDWEMQYGKNTKTNEV